MSFLHWAAAAVVAGDLFQAFSHFLFEAASLFRARCRSGGRPALKCADIRGRKEKKKKVSPISMAFALPEVFLKKSASQDPTFPQTGSEPRRCDRGTSRC